jgi:thiamine-phosphate pyrophosphorylase
VSGGGGGSRAPHLATSLPLVAIGGITRENARQVVEAGADGVAVISDLMDAPDLARAFTELAAAIRG